MVEALVFHDKRQVSQALEKRWQDLLGRRVKTQGLRRKKGQATAAQAFTPRTWEAEVGGSL